MKIGEVYGKPSYSKLLKSISSTVKTMFIEFKKVYFKPFEDEGANVSLIASINYKKINFDCQTWLDVKRNVLMSLTYPINTTCSWLISSKFGSYITLNFTYVEVIN